MNKNCGIYKITSPTGKVYIGQAIDLQRRKVDYGNLKRVEGQPRIFRSIKKYGFYTHQFDIIEYCTEEELNCSERFWQDEFNVIGRNGLNCVLQECGDKKRVISEETRKRKSLAQMGDRNHFYGKNHTQESKNLIGQKRKGLLHTDEHNKKISLSTQMGNNPRAKKVKDVKSGEIFTCIKEAAVKFNISPVQLSKYLNGDLENPTNLEYLDKDKRPSAIKFKYKNILVLDLNTGVYYYSQKEAAILYGVHKTDLSSMLSGKKKNTTSLIKC